MIGPDVKIQLNALLDGELPHDEAASVTARLAHCPASAEYLADLALLRAELAVSFAYQEPSPRQTAKIDAILASGPKDRLRVVSFRARTIGNRWAQVGFSGALAAMLTLSFLPHGGEQLELLSVLEAAERAAMTHAVVAQEAAPVVPGFELASGRTDIVAGRRSQVLVYQGELGNITLCIWPSVGEEAHDVIHSKIKGAEIAYWNDGRSEFWAETKDPASPALSTFIHAIRPV